jgi:hypothetical protein
MSIDGSGNLTSASSINWTFWKSIREVRIWEAIFLSAGIDPEDKANDFEELEADRELLNRLRRLLQATSDRQKFTPCTLHMGDNKLHGVFLVEFAAWCFESDITMPSGLLDIGLPLIQQRAEQWKRSQGRYTLEEAADRIAASHEARFDYIAEKLKSAALGAALHIYEPGKTERYMYGPGHAKEVRLFYEEAYWNDLNSWLENTERRIQCRFPSPLAEANEAEVEESAAFHEVTFNGSVISWRYWVRQMPTLTAEQAARLMAGLDPDVFANLDNRPNKNDPNEYCKKARSIERLAVTQGRKMATAREWLTWAEKHKFKLHGSFRLEVSKLPYSQSVAITAENLLENMPQSQPLRKAEALSAPVVEAPVSAPLPVTTGDVAHAFNGLRRWDEKAWKDTLGSPPKWLQACIATPGRRGIHETRWNPVLIGAALVNRGHAKQNNIRAKFQTMPQLKPWLDSWKTYEADNFEAD